MEFSYPPFDRYLIRLRFIRSTEFRFHPGYGLHALLCAAVGEHPDEYVFPFAHELGIRHFPAGDPYHFELTFVGPQRPSAESVRRNLSAIGAGARDVGFRAGLSGHFEVEAFELLAPPDAVREVEALRSRTTLTLRFLGPLRLERLSPRSRRERFLNQDHFDGEHFLRKLAGRLAYLADTELEARRLPETQGVETVSNRLTWLEVPSGGSQGRGQARAEGAMGTVELAGVGQEWLPMLVAGQYLRSAGKKTHHGFNAYRIENNEGRLLRRPARTLLARVASRKSLRVALTHIRSSPNAAGVDGQPPRQIGKDPQALSRLAIDLASGSYQPGALEGFTTRKDNGGLRHLAIPTAVDRVAQRSALSVLQLGIETLLEDCLHAYRCDYSEQEEGPAIKRAYAEGFRFVLDADIESFFDYVDWDLLFAKWEALYPDEPLNELLKAWVRSPVVFNGKKLPRNSGLPQGSPVSPMLASFFLDELDQRLLGGGFRLVRLADRLLVMCRSLEKTQRARDKARAALSDHCRRLHPGNSRVADFETGLSYLGFLFGGSRVFEEGDLDLMDGRDLRWLAATPLENLKEVAVSSGAGGKTFELIPLRVRVGRRGKTPLYFSYPEANLRLRNERLVVEVGSDRSLSYPIHDLSHVVFLGRTRATVPLLMALHAEGVPSYLCSHDGEIETALTPYEPNWPLWMDQARCAEDDARRLAFARAIVTARLHNIATTVVRLRFQGSADAARKIRDLERSAGKADTVDSLRGFEGAATRLLFKTWGDSVDGEWRFTGRSRRPPRDPVNSLLSYTYTLLTNHVTTALCAVDLNPRIGLFHESRGSHPALASDLVEELRHLAERLVSAMINRREIQLKDFRVRDDHEYPCLLTPEARSKVIAKLEALLGREFTPPGEEEPLAYSELLHRQALAVVDFVRGQATEYQPLRSRN